MISKSVSFSEELDGVLIFRCVWRCNNHFNLVNTSVRPRNLQIFIGCELSVSMGVCDFIAESTNDVLKRIKKCVCWNTLQSTTQWYAFVNLVCLGGALSLLVENWPLFC